MIVRLGGDERAYLLTQITYSGLESCAITSSCGDAGSFPAGDDLWQAKDYCSGVDDPDCRPQLREQPQASDVVRLRR